MTNNIVIKGGHVIDGSGSPGTETNIAIKNDRIIEVGRNINEENAEVIDATGKVVTPGFIDIKTHSDWTLPLMPQAESKIYQGVTTEVIGHCGYSCAPVLPAKVEELADYLSPSAPWLNFRATNFKDYLALYPNLSVNTIHLVGHNTLRLMAMGMDDRPPTAQELEHMRALLREALDAGAFGMSSGLFTAPGSYSDVDELVALGKVLSNAGARYFTHLRNEANQVLDSLQEAMEFAQQVRVHVQIVHMKLSGTDNWGGASKVINLLSEARTSGIPIDCDIYPYTAASNPLKNLFPPWLQEGGIEAMITRLKASDIRQRLRSEITSDGLNNFGRVPDWNSIRISISPDMPQYAGRTIADIAAERETDDFNMALDYIVEDRGKTRVLVSSISEEDVTDFVRCPDVMIGSDGNSVSPNGVTGQGSPHPRFYGTFPRILGEYCREREILPLHQAIWKMTGASAKALDLKDRGRLSKGYAADITIFDPATVGEMATYQDPHKFAKGIAHVIINGETVLREGEHTGALAGKLLRRQTDGIT
jgi:N-acyl-D-amino-acid deacylase